MEDHEENDWNDSTSGEVDVGDAEKAVANAVNQIQNRVELAHCLPKWVQPFSCTSYPLKNQFQVLS